MRTDLFVYLSGPMTARHGFSMEENVAAGLKVHLDLLQRGIPNFCPQLSGAFPSAWMALTHADWLAYDYAVIDRCTHVLLLPRWETSPGAVLERDYAIRTGKVITSLEGLVAPREPVPWHIFTRYRRKQTAELRPYEPGESLEGISVAEVDRAAGSPTPGDMIARNPANHADQWLIAAEYFGANFEPVED